MPPSIRVTHRDIALRVGVSHVTVSLALKGHPRIPLSRREEITKVAREMGYTPDPMLSSLAAYRHSKRPAQIQSALAWINHWEIPQALRKYKEFDAYWRGASKTAERFGYRLDEFLWQQDMTPQRFETILKTRNIRGILIPPHPKQPDWGNFDWKNFSAIRFGLSVRTPNSHVVSSNQFRAIALAVEKIRDYGYKRVGFAVDGEHDRTLGGLWTGGFFAAQRLLGVPDNVPQFIFSCPQDAPELVRDFKKWLDKHKPDVVLTGVRPLVEALRQFNLRVPEDIAVAATTISDMPVDAGINQNSEEIGRVAVETLIALINSDDRGNPSLPRLILVEGTWVDGSSLPNRNAK
jgi:LacI family transcriptional regulator